MSIRQSWRHRGNWWHRRHSIDRRQPIGNNPGMTRKAKTYDPATLVGMTTAARLAGCDRLWLRTLVQRGDIAGCEIDGTWFAVRSAVETWAANRPAGMGRPVSPATAAARNRSKSR